MEPLRIHLFGGFLLERDGVSLPPMASRVGRSLFAHLVMNRSHPMSRELLAGTFWPDLPEGRARRRLSHTLWQVQDVVNTATVAYLDVASDTLAFNAGSPYWLDVEEFDSNFAQRTEEGLERRAAEALAIARLRLCVDLYRGDFMAGYFDDWVLVEQDHYRQRYLTSLSRLVDVTKASGAYDEALSYARRLTHHDPLNEEAHREVMRLSFLLGRTTDALEQYERLRSVLEEELGTRPSAPTIEIYQKIVRHRRSGVRPLRQAEKAVLHGRRADTPFVGRELERRVLIDAMERVLAGSGGVVLVEGEPGVGKTRLTLESAEDARWRGFEVSWGSCAPDAPRPFAPLIDVLESLTPLRVEQLGERVAPVWLGEVARLVPSLGGEESSAALRPGEEPTRMVDALVHVLGALGSIAPHLVIIDDIHWADRDTLAVLTQLGQRLSANRVMLLLLYRTEEARGDVMAWDVIRQLDRLAGLGRVMLSPLSVFELEEMVRRVLGVARLDPAVATNLHRRTGGNVLFALETLMAIRDRGLFEGGSDPAEVLHGQLGSETMPVAPRVRNVIEARISMLATEAIDVYQLAAIAGDPVDLTILQRATQLPRPTVLSSVDELLHRGLLREDGAGWYRIAHDQIRQVVHDGIPQKRRGQLHRVLATTLAESHPERVEMIGHHFVVAGDDVQAAVYLEMAGRRAMEVNAYATAAQHFEAAAEAATGASLPAAERYRILASLEDVLNVLGRRNDQGSVVEQMTELAEPVTDRWADLERRRAWLAAQTGDLAAAEASALRAVALDRAAVESEDLAVSLIALGTIRRWSGRPLDAVPDLEEAVASARRPSDQANALTELASTLVEVQSADRALHHLSEAAILYQGLDDLRGLAEVAGTEARAQRLRGDRDQAIARYEDAIELCRRIGYRHGEGVNLTNLANLHQLLGGVARALEHYDQAARIFEELGNRRGRAMVLANSASARHNLLGDDDRARADAEMAMGMFADFGDRARIGQCEEILAGIAARRGDHGAARTLLEKSLAALSGTGNVVLEGQHLRSLALLQLAADDPEAAQGTLDRATELSEVAGLEELGVDLLSIRGLALMAAGDFRGAVKATGAAVDRLAPGVERPYLVLHRHAIATQAAGEEPKARKAALEAERMLFEALGGLATEQLDRAIADVPEHRAIVSLARRHVPQTMVVDLPVADAPMGKTLDQAQLRTVTWTVEHPDDELIRSPIERRRARLARLLAEAEREGVAPSSEHLAEALEVSASTVRRDLSSLRAAGLDVVTRGHRRRVS